MDTLMTSDYSYVHSNGAMHTKTEEIAEALSQPPRLAMTGADSLKVRVYGDAAVITGVYSITDSSGGGKRMRRFTATWVMRRGRWQQASGQSSVVSQD